MGLSRLLSGYRIDFRPLDLNLNRSDHKSVSKTVVILIEQSYLRLNWFTTGRSEPKSAQLASAVEFADYISTER